MIFGFHIDSPNPCSPSPLILVIDSPTWGRPLIVLSSSPRNGDVQGLKEVLIYAWCTVNSILVFCKMLGTSGLVSECSTTEPRLSPHTTYYKL